MTKEEERLVREYWELLVPDLARSWHLEDALRESKRRLYATKLHCIRLKRELEIGEAVLAKVRKP